MNAIIDMIEPLINQEVEKRIAERMPSEEESKKEADELFEGTNREFRKGMYSGFLFGIQWLRSRLTPQVTPQVIYIMFGEIPLIENRDIFKVHVPKKQDNVGKTNDVSEELPVKVSLSENQKNCIRKFEYSNVCKRTDGNFEFIRY